MIGVAEWIDTWNRRVGVGAAWLSVALVLVQFLVVVERYMFGYGSLWVQELVIYIHGTMFMVGAGYALLTEGHVRVDVFYRNMSPRAKALVNACGVLLLLWPVCLCIWYFGWTYTAQSWAVFEGSKEASGIHGVYLLKSMIQVFVILVALQGASLMLRSLAILSRRAADYPAPDDAQSGH